MRGGEGGGGIIAVSCNSSHQKYFNQKKLPKKMHAAVQQLGNWPYGYTVRYIHNIKKKIHDGKKIERKEALIIFYL